MSIQAQVMQVSPEVATEWLNMDRQNRPLRSGQVDRFARDMVLGQWRLNGEPIIIASDHALLDGQHRLYAVIESGKTIPMLVVKGVEANTRGTIDTGMARTFGDVVGMQGTPYAALVARAAKLWWWYDHTRPKSPHAAKPSHSDLQKVLQHRPGILGHCAQIGRQVKSLARVAPAGVVAFVYGGAEAYSPDLAEKFLDGLATGADLSGQSPIRAYRERIMRIGGGSDRRLRPDEQVAMLMKTWNMFAAGEGIRLLRWVQTEGYPNFFGDKAPKIKTIVTAKQKAARIGHKTRRAVLKVG